MKTTILTSIILVLLSGPSSASDAVLFFEAPDDLPQPGEIFEVSLYVTDGSLSVISYALRVHYDPKVLNVVEINGGKDAVYSGAPLSDSGTFANGVTDFTAIKAGGGETPDTYQIARIRFTVIGQSRATSTIGITSSPTGGLVDGKHFRLLDAQMPATMQMRVGG